MKLQFLKIEDYAELKEVMIEAYATMPGSYWGEKQIKTLVENKNPIKIMM